MVGVSTFGLDLVLLWVLIETFELHYALATPLAFFVATSLNYFVSRSLVFKSTKRNLLVGYLFFLKFSIVGATITTFLMFILEENTDLHFSITRIIIAGFVGMGNYLANLYLNFRVNGKKLS